MTALSSRPAPRRITAERTRRVALDGTPGLIDAIGAGVRALVAQLSLIDPSSPAAFALQPLTRTGEPPFRTALARAVTTAAERLQAQHPTAAATICALLADPHPAAAQFLTLALGDLMLAEQPTATQLVDRYRRDLCPQLRAVGHEPPPWPTIGPALATWFSELLPQAIRDQPRLRRALSARIGQEALAQLHERIAPTPPNLRDQLAGQAIVAREGARISHIQQTIVHGDLYSITREAADLTALYTRYRAFVIESFGAIDFRGMLQIRAAARISLEQIYIPVMAQTAAPPCPDPGAVKPDEDEAAPPSPQRFRWARPAPEPAPETISSLHELVCAWPMLVVLGDPGSGKSTLVRYILLALARGESQERLGLAPIWLPIFFPVAAFADARAQPGRGDLAPLSYLREYYQGLSQPDYGPLFERALSLGSALLLFDGLDEVREDRQAVIRCLEAFIREWDGPGNRFIATSRIVGYADAPLDPTLFATVTIQPFVDAQIEHFIDRWSRAYLSRPASGAPADGDLLAALVQKAGDAEYERQVAQQRAALQTAVFADPRVSELARIPLLLTILVLIHHQGARLPDRRIDLYRLCVKALAETWNRTRSLTGKPIAVALGSELIDERVVVNLLGPVALHIHSQQPGGLVDQSDLEAWIGDVIQSTEGLAPRRAYQMARGFVELMRRDTGLLQERGYRRFGFLHLTFEEYLAARGLLESVAVSEPDALFHAYCVDPRWREVLRLAVASASQREAQRLLLHILESPTTAATTGRPTLLAGDCLVDIGRSGAGRVWMTIVDRLVTLIGDEAAPATTRIEAGALLGKLDDPRRLSPATGQACGAGSHPVADYWCPIAAGDYWQGEGHSAGSRRHGLQIRHLPYDFRIARYPVTNAEYRVFVEAGGYREVCWWTPEGWRFIRQGAPLPATIGSTGPICEPGLWGAPQYRAPSQPVVGVSWYEAAAYCAWLTATGRRAGWLAPDQRLRLPTASERERAARHTDRRQYPWGDERPTPERANYGAAGQRAPAPVGCYPAGAAACGALDLAGNVWEWTATVADSPTAAAPCDDVAPGQMPVIKGGAFNWDSDHLRCGAFYWFSPIQRFNLLGFRVVLAPAGDAL